MGGDVRTAEAIAGRRVARLAVEVAEQFGDTESASRNLTAVRTAASPIEVRRKALQTLAAQRRPELVPELRTALDDPALRVDAIRAIAAFDDDGLGKLLVARFQTFSSVEKAEAIQTLASRGRYGRMLTEALATDVIPKRDVPPYVARQLRRVVGVRFAEVWGPVEEAAAEERAYATLPRPAERQGDGGCQRRQRTVGLSAHLWPVPQDVRRGRHDRS